jgi:hypothetical protein
MRLEENSFLRLPGLSLVTELGRMMILRVMLMISGIAFPIMTMK